MDEKETAPLSTGPLEIAQAVSAAELGAAQNLFQEYARSLEISLCFQNFDQELANLPGNYAPPEGRLLLARAAAEFAGCVALRVLEPGVCEMKRLFVKPNWRHRGLGRTLATHIIAEARKIGYSRMRLDTLASMKKAISLYRSLGFQAIQPYYENPSELAVFMELSLSKCTTEDRKEGRLAI